MLTGPEQSIFTFCALAVWRNRDVGKSFLNLFSLSLSLSCSDQSSQGELIAIWCAFQLDKNLKIKILDKRVIIFCL